MKHKYNNEWDACDQYSCGAFKFTNSHTHPFMPYVCQKGDCLKCQEAGYTPPVFETSLVEIGEMIRYSRFAKSAGCTVPGHEVVTFRDLHRIQDYGASGARIRN